MMDTGNLKKAARRCFYHHAWTIKDESSEDSEQRSTEKFSLLGDYLRDHSQSISKNIAILLRF